MWLVSMYLQYFEYKRGLPHAWYTHQIFWILSALSHMAVFVCLVVLEGLFDLASES